MARAYGYSAYGRPEVDGFFEADPVPGPGELRVAVRAAGVNPADWKRRSGRRGEDGVLAHPVGLGREVAGIVDALGEGVSGFAVGDEVLGQVADGDFGGFAEQALVAASWTVREPAEVSFVDEAALPIAAATAYDALSQLAPGRGETFVVLGAGGGCGIVACQLARLRGADVIGVASAAKRALVESVGAAHVASGDTAVEAVQVLAPDGVDALFDLVGGSAPSDLSSLLADGSMIVTAADGATATELGGSQVRQERSARVLEEIVQLVRKGELSPFVTQVFPFDQAGEALRLVEGGHATSKVVVVA